MASYISSNANRFYTALESRYGQVGSITAANRIPAVKLGIQQQVDAGARRDKTGSRTYPGMPGGMRRRTSFELKTYLTNWDKNAAAEPGYAPLFEGALGGTPLVFGGGTAAAGSVGRTLIFAGPHNLIAGQAVAHEGEIRFVSAILDGTTVLLNAPFSNAPAEGATVGKTLTMVPSTELPSVSIFDYWSPVSSVQRLLCGAGVNRLELRVNGDYHEIDFAGIAQEVADSSSFSGAIGGLTEFPPEPLVEPYNYSVVPGHMGQAWLGTSPDRFYTLTSASVVLDNDLDVRNREFGTALARALSPGQRKVTTTFELFSMDDDATKYLYQAAKNQSPIQVMLQLGEVEGQLLGVYLQSVIPEVPEFDDSENRLQWRFRASRAQGTVDDEISVAFG